MATGISEGKITTNRRPYDYKELMTKYAIKGQGECGYIPCLEITRHPIILKNKWKKNGIVKI